MDVETAQSLAGVVRLLRRAAELVWEQVDASGPGSARQVLALGMDLAADEAAALLSGTVQVAGPVPVGADPRDLLRSAERLLGLLSTAAADPAVRSLRVQVRDLVWEANTGAEA